MADLTAKLRDFSDVQHLIHMDATLECVYWKYEMNVLWGQEDELMRLCA